MSIPTRTRRHLVYALLGAVSLVAIGSVGAIGCSTPRPSVSLIAAESDAIALVRVLDSSGPSGDPTGYSFRVLETVRGDIKREFSTSALIATACRDRIAPRVGSQIVLALGVPFHGLTINPYWIVNDDGSVDSWSAPAHDDLTLQALLTTLGADLPDTSMGAGGQPGQSDQPRVLLSLSAALGAVSWALWSRRVRAPSHT